MKASWKTSLSGVSAILGGLMILVNMATSGHLDVSALMAAWTALVTGVGLIFARDHTVSSEAAGVTPAQLTAVAALGATPPASAATVAKAAVALALALTVFTVATGCKSGASTALKANGAVITTVDGAMKGWATYTQTHTVPGAEIIAVSNAYVAYYNAELITSNTVIVAVTQTNTPLLESILASAGASQTNLLNLIAVFSKP